MRPATPRSSAQRAVGSLERPQGRSRRERAFELLLLLSTAIAVLVLAVLIVDTARDGLPRLNGTLLSSYTSRFPDQTGIRAGLTGTLSLMALVALFAFPIGVGAAVYLEEFAGKNWAARLIETNISNLAGVPSIVYGLLGVAAFVYLLRMGASLLAGALTLTLLILPVIIVAAREAIRAVPSGIREGGLALGATPLQVVSRQVLPAAMPGILTGAILAISRAIGETAPIIVVGALFSRRADSVPWEVGERFAALPFQIFQYVTRPQQEFQDEVAPAAIIVLLVVLLLMNSAAIMLRNRYSRSL